MDNIIPAIPSNVSVILNALIKNIIKAVYKPKTILPSKPAHLYIAIINITTTANPIIPAITLVWIASCPSLAPTTFDLTSLRLTGKAPIRIVVASFLASSRVCCPVIATFPSFIAV